jgi:protein-tyrosine phosphatase
MAFGYRNEAISILGRELMQERGLTGLGIDTIDVSREEIRQAFEVLIDDQRYPIMIHCTQGKDRTGLMVMLVLLLVSAPVDAISQDYVKSESDLLPEKEERMKEISSIGLSEEFAGCPPDFVEKVTAHIEHKYGGVENYLRGIGITTQQQEKLRNILLV